MRVMTWNVWGRFGPWQERETAISETIASERPDVLALQETWSTGTTTQADLLASRHGLHAAFAPSHMPDDPDVELGLAVLSRWPIAGARQLRLETGDGLHTVALMTDVQHPEGTLRFMTACLDWEEDRQAHRLRQARELLAVLTSPELDGPLPVVLAGDLNAPPHTVEIHELAGPLTDCWAAGQTDPGHTFDSANPHVPDDDWHTDTRIDYVFARPGSPARPVNVESAALAGRPVAGRQVPSDHYAVVVELSSAT
jgi:endonuclease/exonuclease/phosphatase family metal-dependent hydrolase